MKKYCFLICGLLVLCFLLSACKVTNKKQTINYQRKLTQYLPAETNSHANNNKSVQSGTVDLSEGPKLKYDANFGPQDVNFDFKIQNPY